LQLCACAYVQLSNKDLFSPHSTSLTLAASMKLQHILGTRSRTEAVLAWSVALGGAYFLFQLDKSKATHDAVAAGAGFSGDDVAKWNAQIKAGNPKEFNQEAAKAAAKSRSTPVVATTPSATLVKDSGTADSGTPTQQGGELPRA
jgi:hypothetical protein